VADITGVDRLEVPVVGVVRPLSSIQVYSWGKGVTLLQAKISGMMEAIERHSAENCELSWIWESWEDLKGPKVPVDLLALKRENFFSPHRRERWVKGWDLFEQQEVYAPLRLVHLSFVRDFPEDTESFQGTSNGLSAGNTFLEALCSGLYECIERDAVTCWELYNQARGLSLPGRRVLEEDMRDPLLGEMLQRCHEEEVEVLLLDCTVNTRVPTYACYLRDQRHPEYGLYQGRGTHLNPQIAMLRAFTEAAQSRAVYFLGSHDGASLETHHGLAFGASVPLAERGASLEIAPPPEEEGEGATFEEDVTFLLEKIRSLGLPRVLVWDLTDPALGVPVLRVLVPGLEGWRMHHYAPGKRGQEFARKGASS
jgi:ribosomal protein S12 methylthiotransferase accessory factor